MIPFSVPIGVFLENKYVDFCTVFGNLDEDTGTVGGNFNKRLLLCKFIICIVQ